MALTNSIAAPSRADTLAAPTDIPPALPSSTPCRSWCEHDVRFPTVHESAPVQLSAPMGLVSECGDVLSAWISVDDDFADAPEVMVAHDGNAVSLPAAEAVEYAGRLMAVAQQIHAMARAALATPAAA